MHTEHRKRVPTATKHNPSGPDRAVEPQGLPASAGGSGTERGTVPDVQERGLALTLVGTILLICYFLGSGVGYCEERRRLDLATPLLIHGGAQALDHFSTQAALARGGREMGPVASRTGPNAARVLGSAAFIGADILAQRKGKKWLVWTVRVASVAVGGYAAIHNSKVRK